MAIQVLLLLQTRVISVSKTGMSKMHLKQAFPFPKHGEHLRAYLELLDCFEIVGVKLRPEMDRYFSKFRNDKIGPHPELLTERSKNARNIR